MLQTHANKKHTKEIQQSNRRTKLRHNTGTLHWLLSVKDLTDHLFFCAPHNYHCENLSILERLCAENKELLFVQKNTKCILGEGRLAGTRMQVLPPFFPFHDLNTWHCNVWRECQFHCGWKTLFINKIQTNQTAKNNISNKMGQEKNIFSKQNYLKMSTSLRQDRRKELELKLKLWTYRVKKSQE